MTSDGSDQRQLTSGSFDLEPDFSPDGERVVFVRWPSDRGDYFDLMTMNPDGTGVERVPAGGDITYRNPRWSPDGARLTGWAKNRDDRGTVWRNCETRRVDYERRWLRLRDPG